MRLKVVAHQGGLCSNQVSQLDQRSELDRLTVPESLIGEAVGERQVPCVEGELGETRGRDRDAPRFAGPSPSQQRLL
jgi:hypothetical protein